MAFSSFSCETNDLLFLTISFPFFSRFGPGPHRVKVSVEFFHDVSYPGSGLVTPHVPERYFIVELAPISLMPHAVHLFLEQVEHKLWDGCAFVLNAGHVLQASPVAPNYMQQGASEYIDKITPFKRARLEKLGYSEFTPEYHHTRWTIGFAGRPSGPDWYINLDDNSLSHGPGMQEHHALTEDADPCFGKVIEGFDVVEEMKKQETANGVFLQYIHIKSAVIHKEPSTSTISIGPGKVNDPTVGQGATATAGGGLTSHDGIPSDINLPKNFAHDAKVHVENVHMTAHARGV
jgi:cyclophilin family peptidyl-prolyl cis-trans isomerase